MPSTVIKSFRYQPDAGQEITFVSGQRYRYPAVTEPLYRRMRASFSKGKFFNEHIRGHFDFAPVENGK
jgi:hypothetical protein